jgi:hypothetical protein
MRCERSALWTLKVSSLDSKSAALLVSRNERQWQQQAAEEQHNQSTAAAKHCSAITSDRIRIKRLRAREQVATLAEIEILGNKQTNNQGHTLPTRLDLTFVLPYGTMYVCMYVFRSILAKQWGLFGNETTMESYEKR